MNLLNKIIFVLFAFIFLSCSASSTKTTEDNKEFCFDLIRIYDEIYSHRTKQTENTYETFYRYKKGLDNAKLIQQKWVKSKNKKQLEALSLLNASLSELNSSINILLNSSFPLSEQKSAKFKIDFEEGSQKLYEVALIVAHPKTGLKFDKKNKDEIIQFAKQLFEKELKNFSSSLEKKEKISWEIFAVATIAGYWPK